MSPRLIFNLGQSALSLHSIGITGVRKISPLGFVLGFGFFEVLRPRWSQASGTLPALNSECLSVDRVSQTQILCLRLIHCILCESSQRSKEA